MTHPAATLSADDLLREWVPRRIGQRVLVLADCTSTNDVAFEAAAAGPADGLVVLADHQSAGRGRQGRAWTSPRGASVLCSVALEAPAGPTDMSGSEATMGGRLTLAGAVAACEAIREATEVAPSIKWPNDLRVAGRKLAGILIESRALQRHAHTSDIGRPGEARGELRVWVIGIGINCLQHAGHFPPELRDATTSLEIESEAAVDRPAVARALIRRLDQWLGTPFTQTSERTGADDEGCELYAEWSQFAEPLGEHVRLRSGGCEYSGRIVSIDPGGGLIVQVDERGPVWFDPMHTKLL